MNKVSYFQYLQTGKQEIKAEIDCDWNYMQEFLIPNNECIFVLQVKSWCSETNKAKITLVPKTGFMKLLEIDEEHSADESSR